MEPEAPDEPKPQTADTTSSDSSSEPAKPLWRRLADMALVGAGVAAVFALSLAGMTHLSDMERCSWTGAEFAMDWRSTWSSGCLLEVEGRWTKELIVREKMRVAEAEVDRRRAGLVTEIQDARAQGRAENSADPEAARQARELHEELRRLDEARSMRRDQAGEELGGIARRKLLLDFLKREKKP